MQVKLLVAVFAVLMAALLTWVLYLRRRDLAMRMAVVANLNHELRNALEIILQSQYLPATCRSDALLDSADRINRALTEILDRM